MEVGEVVAANDPKDQACFMDRAALKEFETFREGVRSSGMRSGAMHFALSTCRKEMR
jgi:hypothetical protein